MRRYQALTEQRSNDVSAMRAPILHRRRFRCDSTRVTIAHGLCAMLTTLACAPGVELVDIDEHAYALHLSGVGSSGAHLTVDEGSAFVVELLLSVETALADEDEADDELDALAAFVACDSGGRVLQVSGVTWLPGGSGGYGWADFSDDVAIGSARKAETGDCP